MDKIVIQQQLVAQIDMMQQQMNYQNDLLNHKHDEKPI